MNFMRPFIIKQRRIITLFILFPFMFPMVSYGQKVVLIEQFTNSGCPPCAVYTPQVKQFVDQTPGVVMIAYHPSFPYSDSMYFDNPVDNTDRVSFYGISSTPSSVFEGNVFTGPTAFLLPNLSAMVNSRQSIPALYGIQFLNVSISGNQLTASIEFTSFSGSNQSAPLNAFLVATEHLVLKSSYNASPGANTETEYPYVMRKMFPNANGTVLQNRQLNGKDTISISWTVSKFKDISELRLVAFVQHINSREVLQAGMATPQISTGITEESNNSEMNFQVIPNPASNEIVVTIPETIKSDDLFLFSMRGERIKVPFEKSGENDFRASIKSVPNGVYYLRVHSLKAIRTKKLIICH